MVPASYRLAFVLVIAGGLNWLMVGVFKLDIIATMFGGTGAVVSRLAYSVIGCCALYCVMLLKPGRPPVGGTNTDPYEEPAGS